jgi:hypothetical protein
MYGTCEPDTVGGGAYRGTARAPAAQYVVTVAGDGYLRSRTPQSAAQSAVHTIYTLRIGATIYTSLIQSNQSHRHRTPVFTCGGSGPRRRCAHVPMWGGGGSPHTAALQSRSPKEAPPTCAWLELLRRAGGA